MTIHDLFSKGLMDSPRQGMEILREGHRRGAEVPLLARVALILGAWLSGIFLAFFLGLLIRDTLDTPPVATTIGAIVIAGSLLLFRKTEQLFLEQLALAINFSGTLLFVYGAAEWVQDIGFPANKRHVALVVVTLLCPIVLFLSRNAVQQFLSFGWVFTVGWLTAFESKSTPLLIGCFVLSMALFLFAWLGRPNRFLNRSAMYAGLVATVVSLILINAGSMGIPNAFLTEAAPWLRSFVVLGLAVALLIVLGRSPRSRFAVLAFLILVVGVISWAGAPGAAFAIGLMAIAHAIGDRAIALLAPILLTGFLILFYYYLGVPLLTKSLWLMGLGVVLLLAGGISFRVLAPRLSR